MKEKTIKEKYRKIILNLNRLKFDKVIPRYIYIIYTYIDSWLYRTRTILPILSITTTALLF